MKRRITQSMSFCLRLKRFAQQNRNEAARLPPGRVRDELLHKAEQAENAIELEGWLSSRELFPPE